MSSSTEDIPHDNGSGVFTESFSCKNDTNSLDVSHGIKRIVEKGTDDEAHSCKDAPTSDTIPSNDSLSDKSLILADDLKSMHSSTDDTASGVVPHVNRFIKNISEEAVIPNEDLNKNGSRFECIAPGCGFVGTSPGNLVLHLHTHFKFEVARSAGEGEAKFSYVGGKFQCLSCPLVTPHRIVFQEHARHHYLVNPYCCGYCDQMVSSVTQLHSHTREAHEMMPAQLDINESDKVVELLSRFISDVPVADKGLTVLKPPENSTDREVGKTESNQNDFEKDLGEKLSEGSQNGKEIHKMVGGKTKTPSPPSNLADSPPKLQSSKPAVKQNFKYLVTSEGKFSCSECKIATCNVPEFTKHIFEDIHQALRSPCRECDQKGTAMLEDKICPIVEKIIKALIRQKEAASVSPVVNGQSDKSLDLGLKQDKSNVAGDSLKLSEKDQATNGPGLMTDCIKDKTNCDKVSESSSDNGVFNEAMALLKNLNEPIPESKMDIWTDPAEQKNEIDQGSGDTTKELDKATSISREHVDKEHSEEAMKESIEDSKGAKNEITNSAVDHKEFKSIKQQNSFLEESGASSNDKFKSDDDMKSSGANSDSKQENITDTKNVSRNSESKRENDAIVKDERTCSSPWPDDQSDGCMRIEAFKFSSHIKKTPEKLEQEFRLRSKSEDSNDSIATASLSGSIPYRCGIPDCVFETKDEVCFKLHHMTKHPSVKIICAVCQKDFSDEDNLVSHWNSDHLTSKPSHSINLPSASIPSIPTAVPSASQMENRGNYPCVIPGCSTFFNRVTELSSHFDQHHPESNGKLPCCFCFVELKNRADFVSHVQTHVKNIAKCSYCTNVYENKEGLLAHIAADHEGRPRRINICIQILNNERQKVADGGKGEDDKVEGKVETGNTNRISIGDGKSDDGKLLVKSEYDKRNIAANSSSSSSAPRPKRRRVNHTVELSVAMVAMAEKCNRCTFTCNTQLQMKLHTYECHEKQTNGGDPSAAFSCRYCSLTTDVKDTLRRHLAHHTGKHVVRYYACPYCQKQSNQMTVIEDHITAEHPDDVFKFEVVQDNIAYLDDMITCPICSGAFPWKPDFLNHLGSVHRLEMVAEYIEKNSVEKPTPSASIRVPRYLFKDTLPPLDDNEFEEEDEQKQDETEELQGESLAGEGRRQGRKDDMIDRYHCDRCDFSCDDFPIYRSHMELHRGSNKAHMEISGRSPSPEELDSYQMQRSIHQCHLCPFECTKKLNFTRHLAIHERNEMMTDGYRCGHCEFRHSRLNCIKFHLGKYHMNEPFRRMYRIINGEEMEVDPDDELMKVKGPPMGGDIPPGDYYYGPFKDNKLVRPVSNAASSWSSAANRLQKLAKFGSSVHNRYMANRFTGGARRMVRAGEERIASDYMESSLPPGMIYAEPMKCPKCDFTNRVRINLVRHMKLHEEEDAAEYTERSWSPEGQGAEDMNSDGQLFGDLQIKRESFDAQPSTFQTPTPSSAHSGMDTPGPSRSATRTPLGSMKREFDDDDNNSESYAMSLSPTLGDDTGDGSGDGSRRVFKCAYCPIISRWNRRDISLHVLHVHMNRRVYGCGYCPYGTSKTTSIIMRHCQRVHPNKPVSVRDDLPTFNAIVPLSKNSPVIPVGYLRPDGIPIWEVDELQRYMASKDDGILFDMSYARCAAASMKSGYKSGGFKSGGDSLRNLPAKRSWLEAGDAPAAKSPRLDQPLDLSSRYDAEELAQKHVASSQGGGNQIDTWTWQCRLCGFQNQRPIRVRNHIVCHHLKLKPYRCPHCGLYLWKSQVAVAHIQRLHPGLSAIPVSTSVERRSYLDRNMVKIHMDNVDSVTSFPSTNPQTLSNRPATYRSHIKGPSKPLGPDGLPLDIPRNPDGTPRSAFYRCKLCGYQESRHDKTKYHLIKQHLKIGLFSCPYCQRYMWGKQYVERHIMDEHPGMEVRIQRTFEEYDEYLKTNIQKIGGLAASYSNRQFNSPAAVNSEGTAARIENNTSGGAFQCDFCNFSAPTDMLLASHRRTHISFECCYCEFRHSLAAKVQSHCLSRHPSQPVRYRKVQDEKLPEGLSNSVAVKSEREGDESGRLGQGRKSGEQDSDEEDTLVIAEGELNENSHGEGGVKGALRQDEDEADPMEVYMCRYCQQLMWSIEDMQGHLREAHPDDPPEFELIQQPPGGIGGQRGAGGGGMRGFAEEDEDFDDDTIGHSSSRVFNSFDTPNLVNLCTLCSYSSVKVSPMRHHVMSHLHYRPFSCPYCDNVHSVKSSPVLKHVRLRHPTQVVRFNRERDEEMERKVKESYRRVSVAEAEAAKQSMPPPMCGGGLNPPSPISGQNSSHPASMIINRIRPSYRTEFGETQKTQRKGFYRCPYCSLVTHIRTDMRHHLMREMHYKPFTCGYCAYTEPSRSGMGKHFRSKHCGMVVDIKDLSDPDMDAKVEKKLNECLVKDDKELAASGLEPGTKNSTPLSSPTKRKPFAQLGVRRHSFQSSSSRSSRNDSYAEPESATMSWCVTKSRPAKIPVEPPSTKVMRCPHCTYSSTALRPLQAHMITHSPYRLQCGYCDHRSHYPSWIRKHIRHSHPGKSFRYRQPTSTFNPSSQVFMQHDDDDGGIEISADGNSTASLNVEEQMGKSSQKHSNGVPVVLDGVPLDITIEPDSDGMYRCKQCNYETVNRAHYKMHSVIHQPRKWKCYYCGKLFPLKFRLRRHCNAKHPLKPVRWIDVSTKQVGNDPSIRSHANTSLANEYVPSPVDSDGPRRTSLKRRRVNIDDDDASDDTVEYNDDCEDEENEMMNYSSGVSTKGTSELAYCCHKCPRRFSCSTEFADHLLLEHARLPTGRLPAIEILPEVDGEDELMLRRCGFCSYESFSRGDFDLHVREHTDLQPHRCSVCTFASFDADEVADHVTANHVGEEIAAVIPLDGSYTMTAYDEAAEAEGTGTVSPGRSAKVPFHFNPIVRLLDVDKVNTEAAQKVLSDDDDDDDDDDNSQESESHVENGEITLAEEIDAATS